MCEKVLYEIQSEMLSNKQVFCLSILSRFLRVACDVLEQKHWNTSREKIIAE